jgi:glucan biosynthesis protein
LIELGNIEGEIAFDALITLKLIVGPTGIVHELANCGFERCENALITQLDLLRKDADSAIEFLRIERNCADTKYDLANNLFHYGKFYQEILQ